MARTFVVGFSPCTPRFDSRPFHVRFVLDKLALGQVFFPSTSPFTCQHHPNNAACLSSFIYIFLLPDGQKTNPGNLPKAIHFFRYRGVLDIKIVPLILGFIASKCRFC